MGNNISNYLSSIGNIVIDTTRDTIQRHEDMMIQDEKNRGIFILTQVLLEMKIKDEMIILMIHKYYGLSELEAEEIMISERTINTPCQELETYLVRSEGYTRDEAVNFIFDKGFPNLLRENKTFWKLTPEQLLTKIK